MDIGLAYINIIIAFYVVSLIYKNETIELHLKISAIFAMIIFLLAEFFLVFGQNSVRLWHIYDSFSLIIFLIIFSKKGKSL